MDRFKPIIFALLCVLSCTGFPGCQTWQSGDHQGKIPIFSGKNKKQTAETTPEKIVAVWTEATHHHPGKLAERGFGGRIVFYDAQDRPLEITGRVTVFVFDDQHPAADDPAPKYKFVFPEDVITSHYSKSDLGHSYSFWIPLAAIDSPTVPLSLVVRYDSPKGERVLSDLTKKVLVGTGIKTTRKGKKRESDPLSHGADNMIRQVGFDEPVNPSNARRSLETGAHGQVETIQVSPNFARRLNTIQDSSTREPIITPTNVSENFSALPASQNLPAAISNRIGSANLVSPKFASKNFKAEERTGDPELQQSGFSPRRSQAPWRSGFQPTGAAPRREPHPGGWQLGLPPTPRTGFGSGSHVADPATTGLAARAQLWFEQTNQNSTTENRPSANSGGSD